MIGPEKRLHDVKIRLTDTQLMLCSKLAHDDDRSLADYINRIITVHLFGHGSRVIAMDGEGKQSIRPHEGEHD